MKFLLSLALSASLVSPVLAQTPPETDPATMDPSDMDHSDMDHGDMDHAGMDHGDHDHASDASDAMESSTADGSQLTLASEPDLVAALNAGGTPVVATVLGAVCDFCALAMNKTFSKRDEVDAVYVDLDDKTLNLVLKAGAEMDDETLTDLVKKAGYKIDVIDRTPALPS